MYQAARELIKIHRPFQRGSWQEISQLTTTKRKTLTSLRSLRL